MSAHPIFTKLLSDMGKHMGSGSDHAALAQHQHDEREAHFDYLEQLPDRQYEAREKIEDKEELKKIMNDEDLAAPLARCMELMHSMGQELADPSKDLKTFREVYQELRVVELHLTNWMMGR